MKVIPPITIAAANIVRSNTLEPNWATTDYPNFIDPPTVGNTSTAAAWDKTAAYAVRDIVYVESLWRMYQCAVAVAAGTDNTRPDRDTTAWADAGPYEVVWQSATAVPILTRRIRRETHRTYIALRAITTSDTTPPEDAPTVWQDIGATNAWAAFDLYRNTQMVTPKGDPPLTGMGAPSLLHPPGHTYPSFFQAFIKPNKRCDSLALTGMQASQMRVAVLNSAETELLLPERVIALQSRPTTTWSEYFFGLFRPVKSLVIPDIPMFADAVIRIELISEAGPVRLGSLVLGRGVHLGKVLAGARSGALNFSKVDRDEYGNTNLIRRRSVPRFTGRVLADAAKADSILDLREELNAVPAVWVGLEEHPTHAYYESSLILGIYKQMEVDLQHAHHMYIDLDLEEI